MTKTQVMALLKENRNEQGIANWSKYGSGKLKSYGIGLTRLRKLAKKVGRDHELAQELWKSDVYDARVIGALIDEPKKMTREQAEAQVEDLRHGMLSHVYCSCDATLPKTSFARELAVDWMASDDPLRRRCGYGLLYELGKNTKDKALTDEFFTTCVNRIRDSIHGEENWVRDAMNASLLSIGKRNAKLNRTTLKAAKEIGPVQVDYGDTGCEALDVVKHLTSDSLRKKLKG